MSDIPELFRGMMARDVPVFRVRNSLLDSIERRAMMRYRQAEPDGKPWQALTNGERDRWVKND